MEFLANYWLSIVAIVAVIVVLVRLVFGTKGIAAHAESGEGGGALGNAIMVFLALAAAIAAGYDIISDGRLGAAMLDLIIMFITGG